MGLPNLLDVDGNPFFSQGTTQTVVGSVTPAFIPATQAAFSTGRDASLNPPSIPNIGAAFASGVFGAYVLVGTVQADPTRFNIEVHNASGGMIVIVRDDGSAAAGSPPTNASLFTLAPNQSGQVGSPGQSWASTTFKGRLQIYATTTQVFVPIIVD